IGICAIAWGERGVIGAQLPEGDAARSRARLARRFPEAREMPPPEVIGRAIDEIVALIAGEPRDLHSI
ncbi:hypothetical protein, partial [Klebsiella pneumoniae]|uniref:hypothetical protein n=1 Tax=Klebsiella pneumoniae TaxID=573 RepID=UPI001953C213